jgi:adenosylhomocysteine nucleosidase
MSARFVWQWMTALLAAVFFLVPAAPAQCLTECSPRFGIVSAFGGEADLLLAETTQVHKYEINGNEFATGVLRGNRVLIVLTGVSIENAAMVTQLMIDHFRVHHILVNGISGGLDPTTSVGDVIIPNRWAFPLEGFWSGDSKVPSPCGSPGDLSCVGLQLSPITRSDNSDYQIATENGPVGTGFFMRDTLIRTTDSPQGEYKFDYAVDPAMFKVARMINPVLLRCSPNTPSFCVPAQPVIRRGGRGLTGPIFLANANYRDYVFNISHSQTIDMETTAVAHVAFANHIPFLAFRSLADMSAGVNPEEGLPASELAIANSSAVALAFLDAWSECH